MGNYAQELLLLMLINYGVGKYVKRRALRDIGVTIYSEALIEDCVAAGWLKHTPDSIGLSMYCLTEEGVKELKRE